LVEIQEFFETYKRLEPHKWAKAEEWKNAKEAMEIVKDAMKNYQKLPMKLLKTLTMKNTAKSLQRLGETRAL